MGAEELRKLLEEVEDKFSIFEDDEMFSKYRLTALELSSLIRDFLTDDEKIKLFGLSHFKNLKLIAKPYIVETISDEGTKLKLLLESDILSNLESNELKKFIDNLKNDTKLNLLLESDIASNLDKYQLCSIIDGLENDTKLNLLLESDIFEKYKIDQTQIKNIIESLDNESIEKFLLNKSCIEKILDEYNISKLICNFEKENVKVEMIELYGISDGYTTDILKTFSDETKKEILIENKYNLNKNNMRDVISSFNNETLLKFIKENKEVLEKNNIEPYNIIRKIDSKSQLEFISKFEDIGLSIKEKKQILATLASETKESVDKTNFSQQYLNALEVKTEYGFCTVDYNENLEKYKDLDELLIIKATQITEYEKQRLYELCDICPNLKIYDELDLNWSTATEYKNAETWIDSILQGMQEDWSDIQKVAYIDNAIGKKISYSPDFNTEVYDAGGSRTLWKIIDTGYGVCNGISQVEKYILDRVGIESQMVGSQGHAFLKLKNITLPTKDGNEVTGDTILDPTWNLTAHRYSGKPTEFCKSYEEIRKGDICDGKDYMCHKNDEDLASATLNLDEECLRDVFKSIGLADKEGKFPISDFLDKLDEIYNSEISQEEMIGQQFALLAQYCPDFAKCQNSTMSVLESILLDNEKLDFNRCVVKRVYDRKDENKTPIIYTYIDLPGVGKKFYYGDGDSKQFVNLSKEEFEERFECYEMDMKALDGRRDWEIELDEKIEEHEDLARSSGKVATKEGEER